MEHVCVCVSSFDSHLDFGTLLGAPEAHVWRQPVQVCPQ